MANDLRPLIFRSPLPTNTNPTTARLPSLAATAISLLVYLNLIAGCALHTPKSSVLRSSYINTALGFHMKFDATWRFQSSQQNKQSYDHQGRLIIESQAKNQEIASIYRFSSHEPQAFNDSLQIYADTLKEDRPQVAQTSPKLTAEQRQQYLSDLSFAIQQTNSEATFGHSHEMQLNGRDFTILPITFVRYGLKIFQTHYVTATQDRIINFVATHVVKNHEKVLRSFLESIEFETPPKQGIKSDTQDSSHRSEEAAPSGHFE